MVKAAETKDLATLIRHHEGKGAGAYFFVKESHREMSEGRINAKELGQIRNAVEKLTKKGGKITADFLMNPFCPWSDKIHLHADLEEAGINDVEAYEFMANFHTGAKGVVKKTDAQKLASILASLAPVLPAEQLMSKLEGMVKEHKDEAVKLVKKMETENKRDSNGWIYTTTEEQRDKMKAYKMKK